MKACINSLAILSCMLIAVSTTATSMDNLVLDNALARNLPAKAVSALTEIPEPGAKLLAARSYYRSIARIDSRWSWDDAEIAAYQSSDEQKSLLAGIDRIAKHFADANPGYTLYANTRVRSLDQQIIAWNRNASVAAAGELLISRLSADTGIAITADNPKLPEQLKAWLLAYSPKPRPNLAAPGLSAHGQMRAIDFQIEKNGVLIAPADSGKIDSIWRARGWDAKLKASIVLAGPDFQGPLTSPDEPWHYSYSPSHKDSAHDEITR